MKAIATLFFSLTCSFIAAQNEANIWYFGSVGEGLDFNERCDPEVLSDGQIDAFEGCCTISDRTSGELLFYTNSEWVWDRMHDRMPNGQLINGGRTITQVVIIPKPEHNSQYYIFTAEIQGSSGEHLRFHGVDLSLNNGLGDVFFTDSVAFAAPVAEKLTAVRHANGVDIWVIAHAWNTNEFIALRVTSTGVVLPPVISEIGKVHYDASTVDALGELKADPAGNKLAVATAFQPDIELFDFDRSNGTVSNLMTLDAAGSYDGINASGWYGVSFSPDGSKLYAARTGGFSNEIIQFDVSTYNEAAIIASKTTITTLDISQFSMKLAPNGRIYTGRKGNFLGVINRPNSAGLSCNFNPEGVDFGQPAPNTWGLSNTVELPPIACHTGVETQLGHPEPLIGPNPFSESFSVSGIDPGSTMVLHDMQGRVVLCPTAVVNGASVQLPAGSNGIFLASVIGADNELIARIRIVAIP